MTQALLPHQYELLKDTKTQILGLVSGFGAGKTFSVARKAVQLALLNPNTDGIVCEPNFPLLEQILIPELKKALDEYHVKYEYKGGIFMLSNETKIIPKSMESWERLIGINASFVILDEFDTTKPEIAYQAYQKLLGRLRAGSVRQMVIVSTPEGFRAMYRIFVEEKDKGNKRLIHASTLDNYHLPRDYIQQLKDNYPDELIEAYLNGKFVNLNQGQVYRNFDRSMNDTLVTDDRKSDLHIGIDFNVGKMSAVVGMIKDQKLFIVKEFKDYLDTPELIEALQEYQNTRISGTFYVYPDAAGQQRNSVNAQDTNHKLLRAAGFVVRVNKRNPGVQDRVNTVNARLLSSSGIRTLFINVNECPELTKGLEQQAYDKNGKPDKDSNLDHQLDALGYLVSFLFPLTNRPIQKNFRKDYKVHVNE